MDKYYTKEDMEEVDDSSREEMIRQNFLEDLYEAEEERGQGIGTDRDAPIIPKKPAFNPDKNYYPEIKEFAESIGFWMGQSNGVYTLRPCAPRPNLFEDCLVKDFKNEYPEYRAMQGTKAIKYKEIFKDYKGDAGVIELHSDFRKKRMEHWLKFEIYNKPSKELVKHLLKNSYRKLIKERIERKYNLPSLLNCLDELEYTISSINKRGKVCIQLTEKGKEYARKND